MSKAEVTKGSGNVFRDMGFKDAELLEAKAALAVQIHRIIAREGMSQVAAAKLLGMQQSEISNLFNGYIDRFSTERLIRILQALGKNIEIRVKSPKMRDRTDRGHLTVSVANAH